MIFFYISLSTYLCFNILKYKKTLFALKKCKYDIKDYGKYIFKKENFLTKELFAIILVILIFKSNLKVIGIATVMFYTLMFLLEYKKKIKLKLDKKMITRIIFIILIYIGFNIYFILDYISYHYADIIFDNTPFYYLILILLSYLSYIVVWIANVLSKPFDKHRG